MLRKYKILSVLLPFPPVRKRFAADCASPEISAQLRPWFSGTASDNIEDALTPAISE